ncbi:hypothetical protein AB4865_08200 [Capnocytophaga sp. ARDL2]|uniref:hypothetical protein n=1 Tax=Capnocytophaga sp. ARDL2 TaxID=3238809 RepID=UPI0035575FB4
MNKRNFNFNSDLHHHINGFCFSSNINDINDFAIKYLSDFVYEESIIIKNDANSTTKICSKNSAKNKVNNIEVASNNQETNYIQQHSSINLKYPALLTISNIFRILGWICAFLTVVFFLKSLIKEIEISERLNKETDILLQFVFLFIGGFFTFVQFAISELIKVFFLISNQKNTTMKQFLYYDFVFDIQLFRSTKLKRTIRRFLL